ncbi:hypothetical protein M3Y97_00113900 [Aphelenchoides bicaudatus]|nr:hypothetical protein M3Y97_00113900 [Aphelenchoides bicaudatus]
MDSSILKWTCGIGATAFLGYALYFDYCRTRAPDYKQKIREKRKKAASARAEINMQLPNITNREEVQQYFLQQVQLGEELIAQGIIDEGVQHLCNAIILCGQPEQLLAIFQQTLPAEYPKILEELPHAQARIEAQLKDKFGGRPDIGLGGGEAVGTIVDEDDLE